MRSARGAEGTSRNAPGLQIRELRLLCNACRHWSRALVRSGQFWPDAQSLCVSQARVRWALSAQVCERSRGLGVNAKKRMTTREGSPQNFCTLCHETYGKKGREYSRCGHNKAKENGAFSFSSAISVDKDDHKRTSLKLRPSRCVLHWVSTNDNGSHETTIDLNKGPTLPSMHQSLDGARVQSVGRAPRRANPVVPGPRAQGPADPHSYLRPIFGASKSLADPLHR